ncbi:MAG: phosphoglycerate dehydrogenase [Dehalococcoidales bacterium]|jgi:D-3-phosphoglycerate dehydrogenase
MEKKTLISPSSFGSCGDEPLKLLESNDYQPVINPFGRKMTPLEVIEMGKDCSGIIAGVELLDSRVLESLPDLRCISRCGVGTDNVDLEKARELGIMVMNTPDAPTRAVAELAIGVILDLLRNISRCDREIRQGNWYKGMGNLLLGRKIGILGLGRIGRTVAELLVKLGTEVSGSDINPDMKWLKVNRVKLLGTEELLKESDILSIYVSYSGSSQYLIGTEEIESMKKGAFLVNLSRGGIVDEDALYQALKNQHLAGAALDVFEQEPYTGPLKGLDNVVLTSHIGSYARETRLEMEMQAVKNLLKCLTSLSGAKDHE